MVNPLLTLLFDLVLVGTVLGVTWIIVAEALADRRTRMASTVQGLPSAHERRPAEARTVRERAA